MHLDHKFAYIDKREKQPQQWNCYNC